MLKLMATLWPSFPHFERFSKDPRLSAGIRLNSAMLATHELDNELELAKKSQVPLYFDVKGKQLRVTQINLENTTNLELDLNHSIKGVKLPTEVLFKAGADSAVLESVSEDGHHLIFKGGPKFMVHPGESLHVRDAGLEVLRRSRPRFTDVERNKVERVRKAGCKRWFLSYVDSSMYVEEFQEMVGKDSEILLKIENLNGVKWAYNKFQKKDHLSLVCARGDLYVEMPRPHEIIQATKLIIEKDPEAIIASRLLLSVVTEPIPSCADFSELAWLYESGYQRMMLCDELCLKEPLLATAINAFEAFRTTYTE